ncbi:farnesol dehydrogenase-like [Hetaerina americana]|uniref:farnesol dehydrogenase-like n=1 Tax=Hetaerina americana TaxID=62018 RepID=UPI003A7F1DFF
MERWAGRVAVVTGASAGIGASIVTALVDHGMIVIGLARRVELVKELAKKLLNHKGVLYALKADVSKEEDVVAAFDWIQQSFGVVHVLINNAGYAPFTSISKPEPTRVHPSSGALIDNILTNIESELIATKVYPTDLVQKEEYKKIHTCFNTNVMGVIMCTNKAIKIMRESEIDRGHIININSVVGHYVTNNTGFFAYNASKNALTVVTEGVCQELREAKSKIRVTSISPGFVTSEMGITSGIPNLEELIAKHPFLDANNVTESVIHALSAPPNVQVAEVVVRPIGEKTQHSVK